jgi:hypothetical protein
MMKNFMVLGSPNIYMNMYIIATLKVKEKMTGRIASGRSGGRQAEFRSRGRRRWHVPLASAQK